MQAAVVRLKGGVKVPIHYQSVDMITCSERIEENHHGISEITWILLKSRITRLTIESRCLSSEWSEVYAEISNQFFIPGVKCYVTGVYANYATREFGTSIALYCPLPLPLTNHA